GGMSLYSRRSRVVGWPRERAPSCFCVAAAAIVGSAFLHAARGSAIRQAARTTRRIGGALLEQRSRALGAAARENVALRRDLAGARRILRAVAVVDHFGPEPDLQPLRIDGSDLRPALGIPSR